MSDETHKGENNPHTLYAFEYCPCVYESSYGMVSLHRTKRGAIEAKNNHHKDRLASVHGKRSLLRHERWTVAKIQVKQ